MKLEVPIELPTKERLEEIYREEARRVAEETSKWLSFDAAAKHWDVSLRTFERKKVRLGLPVSIVDGVKRIWRDDLDAALRANIKGPKVSVIQWPSLALREADRNGKVAA